MGLSTVGSLDGPSTITVFVRINDATGASRTASTTISIGNKPPVAMIIGPTRSDVGQRITLTLSATDPSIIDTLRKASYTVDFGDGNVATYRPPLKSTTSTMTITHTFGRLGLYLIKVKATDKDGGIGPEALLQVAVGPVIDA